MTEHALPLTAGTVGPIAAAGPRDPGGSRARARQNGTHAPR